MEGPEKAGKIRWQSRKKESLEVSVEIKGGGASKQAVREWLEGREPGKCV